LDWARPRAYFAFVVATLCRLLYTLETGGVASKPAATRWAQETLGSRWSDFIARSWEARRETSETPQANMGALVAFIHSTAARYDAMGFGSAQL
jgi:hypothetical protein